MSSSPTTFDIELHVSYAANERDFLRLTVESAARKHRELQRSMQEKSIRRSDKHALGVNQAAGAAP